jgi:hypothetical protein
MTERILHLEDSVEINVESLYRQAGVLFLYRVFRRTILTHKAWVSSVGHPVGGNLPPEYVSHHGPSSGLGYAVCLNKHQGFCP